MLFALAGLLGLVGITSQPDRAGALLAIAAADLTVAVVAWSLPWARWRPLAPLALVVPAFVVLGFSTWAFGGVAAGTGPFFVLVFAWAGLHFPPRALLAMAAPGAVAYLAPLVVTRQSPMVLSSAMILLPVAVAVSLLIAAQAGHLRRDRQRIRRVERWRAALTAALAHDLRSPLSAVQLVLEELDDPAVEPEYHANMRRMALRQVARMNRLIAGLLDLDRIEAHGRLRLDLGPVNLAEAVRQAVHLLNSEVQAHIPADLVVPADAQRLEQILFNLLGNAVRHGRPPVVIRAVSDGAVVRLSVRDHGPGVPAPVAGHLFSRFGGDPDEPGAAAGAGPASVGLGLWIVRQLARAHGGDVQHEPAQPGACFVVTLPAAPAAAGTAGARSAREVAR